MPLPALKDPYTRTARDGGTGGTEKIILSSIPSELTA
jgi:hypothetical protein